MSVTLEVVLGSVVGSSRRHSSIEYVPEVTVFVVAIAAVAAGFNGNWCHKL